MSTYFVPSFLFCLVLSGSLFLFFDQVIKIFIGRSRIIMISIVFAFNYTSFAMRHMCEMLDDNLRWSLLWWTFSSLVPSFTSVRHWPPFPFRRFLLFFSLVLLDNPPQSAKPHHNQSSPSSFVFFFGWWTWCFNCDGHALELDLANHLLHSSN